MPRARPLPESHICGTNCQAPSGEDLFDDDHAAVHGLRPRRPVAARGVAGPAAQPRDDIQ